MARKNARACSQSSNFKETPPVVSALTGVPMLLRVCAVIIFLGTCTAAAPTTYLGSVHKTPSGEFAFVRGVIDKIQGVAYGSFADTLNATGWGVLNIVTNADFSDADQMYAAGLLEGALTAPRIYQNYQSIRYYFFGKGAPAPEILYFFGNQTAWTSSQINAFASSSPFWNHVGLLMKQFEGLRAGYAMANSSDAPPMDPYAFDVLSATGDLLDLRLALQPKLRPDLSRMTPEEFERYAALNGHCSALVKLTGNYSDLFAGHSSWFTYGAMNRIYKHFTFNLNAPSTAARSTSFSSYPGFLSSLDDFYIMDSGLVILETTNGIYNSSLFELVTPKALFAWQRVRVANFMARTGEEWVQYFKQYNSGTYNNQYMVINYKLFMPGQPLLPNTLWVVEQIPGLVIAEDLTSVLQWGYWASYNIPYFPLIFNLSGYPEIVARYGLSNTHQLAPRAQIFRRDQGRVTDLASMQDMMRYNDFLNDPYANGNPAAYVLLLTVSLSNTSKEKSHNLAICSRYDLAPSHPDAGGCYDSKITSSTLVRTLSAVAISSPTYGGNSDLPPFVWTDQFSSTVHAGQPTVWAFPFVPMQPDSQLHNL